MAMNECSFNLGCRCGVLPALRNGGAVQRAAIGALA